MSIQTILDLENDGLNMAAEGPYLYIRCKRTMYKVHTADMRCAAQNVVFKKDGMSRSFSIGNRQIFLTDFCDLYVLDKEELRTVSVTRMGENLSSDLGAVRFDERRAYISIRNGRLAVWELRTGDWRKVTVCEASSWDFCVAEGRLYTGTVNGELVETDADDLRLVRQRKVCGKNIYSVVYREGVLYTISQDTTLKAIDASTLEVICERKNAAKGMTKILGLHEDCIVVADGGISLWDRRTLELRDRFAFPTGRFNKGALYHQGVLFGSDYGHVYRLAF